MRLNSALLTGFFAVVFALVFIPNQLCFHTFALDLGAYTNALYDYSHLQWNDSSLFKEQTANLLSDHFDLLLPIWSLLSYAFGNWTLLIVQWLMILIGGIGMRKFITARYNETLGGYAHLFFYLHFAVFAALSFDYHSNAVAAMLLPWFFYGVQKRNFNIVIPFFVLILFAKENMSLWMVFVLSGLLFLNRADKKLKTTFGLLAMLSLLYFIVITKYVMPSLDPLGRMNQLNFHAAGNSYSEILFTLIRHPFASISMLFTSETTEGTSYKIEFWIFFLLSGGICALLRPVFLWMLIPVFLQKMLHDDPAKWGVATHYSIELTPVLTWAVIDLISHAKKQSVLTGVLLAFSLVVTVRLMDNTKAVQRRENLRIYQSAHYHSWIDRSAANTFLSMIPPDAAVSAQSFFVPHLAYRDKAYQFPIVKDAQYILLSRKGGTYPMDTASFRAKVDTLLKDPSWKVDSAQSIMLFSRK